MVEPTSNDGETWVDPELEPYLHGGRERLLPALWAAQRLYGYVSEGTARAIGEALSVPPVEVFGVLEFYSMLATEPTGERVVRICTGPVCRAQGAKNVLASACDSFKIHPGEVSEDGSVSIEAAPCLGLCDGAPAALSGDTPVFHIGGSRDLDWIGQPEAAPLGVVEGDPARKTARCGHQGAETLEGYIEAGGGHGLRRALTTMTPDAVIDEIKRSELVGRGGAAFPTGLKWQYTAAAEGDIRYVVANADESEPGTFKDRVLIEGDPFALIEGMTIAGYAIGASRGFLYLRGEYPRAKEILSRAIASARAGGALGPGIMGSDFTFDIELRIGAGAYICGEETALFESIEGKRGHPRIKPPFPTTDGLFHLPTVINNVETLVDVTWILSNGAEAYRQLGSDESAGTKLFCLSGDIQRPGVYEFPFGVTLNTLLEAAGGVKGDLKAILLGGAAGTFVGPDQLSLPMSFEGLRQAGSSLGSGAVMVFNQSRSLPTVLRDLAAFFDHESCGKCLPCQLGTRRQLEIMTRVDDGQASSADIAALRDVIYTMTGASLCGLGVTAGMAIQSALDRWPAEFANGHGPSAGSGQ
jgi:NADH-quinone oxidoreductase subunit F